MLENLTVERKLYNGVGKFKPEKVGNFTPEMTGYDTPPLDRQGSSNNEKWYQFSG